MIKFGDVFTTPHEPGHFVIINIEEGTTCSAAKIRQIDEREIITLGGTTDREDIDKNNS